MDKLDLHTILTSQWNRPQRAILDRKLWFELGLDTPEIVIITGVRRSGKSTLLRLIANQIKESCDAIFVEFDDPNLELFKGKNFEDLVPIWQENYGLSSKKKVFFLDEIQLISGWEKWITHLAKDPRNKLFISGSNATMLSSELSTMLTGRHRSYEVTPFHLSELISLEPTEAKADLYERYFQFGGFPRAYIDRDPKILNEYLHDIIERDVIARHGARLKRPLKELVRFLCTNNTKFVNRKKLAEELGVKDDGTIKRYCDWLTEVYLFQELKKFSFSQRKVARSNPKFYCVDPAFARINGFSAENNEGAFLENLVYNDLRKAGYELGYFLSSGSSQSEVDFIARKGGSDPLAIQVSLTVRDEKTLEREVRGLLAVAREYQIKDLLLITKSDLPRELQHGESKINIIPYVDNCVRFPLWQSVR